MLNVICIWVVVLVNLDYGQANSKIGPLLMAKLNKGQKVNALVFFKNGVQSTIGRIQFRGGGEDRGAHIRSIVEALKANAESSQDGVVQSLAKRSGGHNYFRKYWSGNKMIINGADAQTLRMISEDPQVSRIIQEPIFRVPDRSGFKLSTEHPSCKDIKEEESEERPNGKRGPKRCKDAASWNDGSCCRCWHVEQIQVNEAWVELEGQGKGVVVGHIDTGVHHTHVTLRHNFRGDYGWYDGVNQTLEPFDPHGHGTHTASIAVGKEVGVAPGATWMSCRGCGDVENEDNQCRIEHLFNCIQYMLCPTLADGSNADCTKAPQVLSYSIAGERDTGPLDDDFLVLKTAGIIPVAAVGNLNRECGQTGSPANKPWVIGVGASNYCDQHSVSGASGPAPDGTIKPDIIAPGFAVTGADTGVDHYYYTSTGTSNSAPQVAGVVALLYMRNPNLTFEDAYQLLTENAERDIEPDKHQYRCSTANWTTVPNNFYGYGRVDALATIRAQTELLKSK